MTSRLRLAPLAALCAFIAPAACGDDDSSGDGSLADAGGPDAAPATATAFAVATDFENAGVASTVAIPALDVAKNAIEGVASIDPVVRRLGDRLFIVNRLGQDNVTVLDSSPLGLVA
ncbi:MAG TPA: hypothetical protein VEL05_12570, partial [Candidatus Acidoferrum sp.]|nr:hypothetical protein [Candidatus Acidoferrum sp.]